MSQGDWGLHSDVAQMIWRTYGTTAAVDVFADSHTSHCPRWFSLMDKPGSLCMDALAHNWPDVILYAFPVTTDLSVGYAIAGIVC